MPSELFFNIAAVKLVAVPMFIPADIPENNHWAMAIINLRGGFITFMDSGDVSGTIYSDEKKAFCRLLKYEILRKWGGGESEGADKFSK